MLQTPLPLVLGQFGGGGLSGQLLFFVALFAIMYFVLIRPQQKAAKEHSTLLSSLKKGDDVVTQGGVLGKVYAVAEKAVTLEVANGVRIRVLKSSIQARGAVSDEAAKSEPKAEDAKKEEK